MAPDQELPLSRPAPPRMLSPTGGRGDYRHFGDPLAAGQALSVEEQAALSESVHARHDELLTSEWRKTASRISSSLEHFQSVIGAPGRDINHRVRAIQRTTTALTKFLEP